MVDEYWPSRKPEQGAVIRFFCRMGGGLLRLAFVLVLLVVFGALMAAGVGYAMGTIWLYGHGYWQVGLWLTALGAIPVAWAINVRLC